MSPASEAGFRALFDCAMISIFLINEDGTIKLSNPCAEELFGYEPAELIGQSFERLIPEHLRLHYVQFRDNCFSRQKSHPGEVLEIYARKKNENEFPVTISMNAYEAGNEKLAALFLTDRTDQMTVKRLTEEREVWFKNMADNSPLMIWISGADKNCQYFNNTWLNYTGRKIDDELGLGWTTNVHAEDFERYLVNYYSAFNARQSFVIEYRLRRHDGQYRWVKEVGKPIYIGDVFVGFVGSCSDIHDHRVMKEELEQQVRRRTTELYDALAREKEINELKSRFVSMASHEFRAPLSIVFSSTALIEQYGVEHFDERINKHLSRIKSSIGKLNGILNDFLSLDKLEQGAVDNEPEIFDLDLFLWKFWKTLSPTEEKGRR